MFTCAGNGPLCIAFPCCPLHLFFSACMRPFCPWACIYSLPLLLSYNITPPGPMLYDYEPFLQKLECLFKQLLIKAKVLNTLIYCCYLLVRRSSMHLLSKFELKTPSLIILSPNNLLIVYHSSITYWSQNTLSKLQVNFSHLW